MEYVEGDSLSGLFKAKGGGVSRGPSPRASCSTRRGPACRARAPGRRGRATGRGASRLHPAQHPHRHGRRGALADFGIAKAATRLGHTRLGMVKGKIAYMPPEQAKGMPLDRRCDVWAAGVVAWELLAKRRLYLEDDDVAILLKVATEEPPRLSSVAPEVPRALVGRRGHRPDDGRREALPHGGAVCPGAARRAARERRAWLTPPTPPSG